MLPKEALSVEVIWEKMAEVLMFRKPLLKPCFQYTHRVPVSTVLNIPSPNTFYPPENTPQYSGGVAGMTRDLRVGKF